MKVSAIREPFDCYVNGKMFNEKKQTILWLKNQLFTCFLPSFLWCGNKLKNFSNESAEKKIKKKLTPRTKV